MRRHRPRIRRDWHGQGVGRASRPLPQFAARVSFIPVNCGAIPDALVENELFGHDRGAYTDARITQIGLIAEAAKGTLFLDEVESLSLRAQVALLRFLQDGTYRRLGGRGDMHANVRIIAASNAALDELCDRGALRRDLLYRLMVMSVTMPPLRDRAGDVQLLAAHFIHRFSQQHIAPPLRLTRHSAVISRPTRGRQRARARKSCASAVSAGR